MSKPIILANMRWYRSITTSNTGLPSNAASVDTSNANPQQGCPLFGRIPAELRNEIFNLALTVYTGKQVPYEKSSYRCRPGFLYADVRIDTALLCTCRRVYKETRLVPQQNYVHVQWCDDPDLGPYATVSPGNIPNNALHPWVNSLHLFISQYWLEGRSLLMFRHPCMRNLKITIRHCDWSPLMDSEFRPLVLDAKQRWGARATKYRQASDDFDPESWGSQLSFFKNLKKLELELETVEERRSELDDIVERAKLWRFPRRDDNVLALNPASNRKTAWRGNRNRK